MDYNKLFTIKCLVLTDPYKVLFVLLSTVILMSAYVLRILEGPINSIDKDSIDFTIYTNCSWCVLVTMTTSKITLN